MRQEDTSRQENEGGSSSSSNVPEKKEKEMQGEQEGFSENNREVENNKDRDNGTEFILDEVDDILNQKLGPDEQTDELNRPGIKPRSSTLTEDPSLLGKFMKCFQRLTGRGGQGRALLSLLKNGSVSTAIKYFTSSRTASRATRFTSLVTRIA